MFRPGPGFAILLLAALAILPVHAFAIPALSISSPGSDGVFLLRGERMEGVAGLDIRVGYDAGTLSNPRVVLGSLVGGMMSAANPGNPIRMALVGTKAISGSGVIATITFDRTGTSPGAITMLTGSLIDTKGTRLAMAQPAISNPSAVVQQEGAKDEPLTLDATEAAGVTLRPYVLGGTVTLPGQESPAAEKKPAGGKKAQMEPPEEPLEREETLPVPEEERAPAPETKPQPPLPQPKKITSVLERFREFQGDPTAANLTALFKKEAAVPYSQIPPIAIADGKSTVTLVIAMATGDKVPNFTFSGCRYVSLDRISEGEWEVEARPDPGVVKASISMLYNGFSQEFPLAVAPKVPLGKGRTRPVTEADFQLFLKERGTAAAPRFDLNKDGRRDYVDDYIYTANYLVQLEQQGKKR